MMPGVFKATSLAAILILLLGPSEWVFAQDGLPAITVVNEGGNQTYSLSIQVLLLRTMLTLLPAA